MHLMVSKSGSFDNFIQEKRPHLEVLMEEFEAIYHFNSNWSLEAYFSLPLQLEQDVKVGFLSQELKQSIIFGDIIYSPENPEDNFKTENFVSYIEDNFNKKIFFEKLSPDFIKRLTFSSDFLASVYREAERYEEDFVDIHCLIQALNKSIPLPIFSTARDYLIKTCSKYMEGNDSGSELAIYLYILNSNVLKEISFEDDYDKKVMRYNGFLCSLISYELNIKIKYSSIHSFYKKHSTSAKIYHILKHNLSNFIRTSSLISSQTRPMKSFQNNSNLESNSIKDLQVLTKTFSTSYLKFMYNIY